MSSLAAVLLTLGLGSCGQDSSPQGEAPTVTEVPEILMQAAPPPPPITPHIKGYSAMYQDICAVRKMNLEPKDGPAQHYAIKGTASFNFVDPRRSPIEQGFEIALGGPTQMRYLLRSDGKHNAFLLESAQQAWLKLPGNTNASNYAAQELAEDASIRWLILRLPWTLKGKLAEHSSWIDLTGFGNADVRWSLQFSLRGLPQKLFRQDATQDSATLHLELKDWSSTEDRIRYPQSWIWYREWGELEERFDEVIDGALFFESAFRPKSDDVKGYVAVRPEDGNSFQLASDFFGLVDRDAVWLNESSYQALKPKPEARQWALLDEDHNIETVFVLANGDADLPSSVTPTGRSNAQLCLLWRSYRHHDPEQAAKRMREAAAQNKYIATGPVWILQAPVESTTALREYLLPVKK